MSMEQEAQKEMQGKKSFKKSKVNKYTKTETLEEISRLEGAKAQKSLYFKHLKHHLSILN